MWSTRTHSCIVNHPTESTNPQTWFAVRIEAALEQWRSHRFCFEYKASPVTKDLVAGQTELWGLHNSSTKANTLRRIRWTGPFTSMTFGLDSCICAPLHMSLHGLSCGRLEILSIKHSCRPKTRDGPHIDAQFPERHSKMWSNDSSLCTTEQQVDIRQRSRDGH